MMTESPHAAVGVSWKNLSVWSQKKTSQGLFKQQKVERVHLLNSVSGYAKAGSLTAVMGSSGAGKTTLLGTVSCRTCYETQGEVLLNGQPIDKERMISISGFMPQHDLAVEELTVLEHIKFMARLKIDARIPERERNLMVDTAILDMGLRKCMNSQLRYLSGGERRKVALAIQLLRDPPLLFCDEPTTGLDSFNASNLVSILKSLAKNGKTIVCTIHQPGSGIFESFDEVILMAAGGAIAYQGSVTSVLDHFKTLGIFCPRTYNTSEFLISQLHITDDGRSAEHVRRICDRFSSSQSYKSFEEKFNKVNEAHSNTRIMANTDEEFMKISSRKEPAIVTQIKWLFWRHGLSMLRNVHELYLELFPRVFVGFMIGIVFRGSIFDEYGVQNLQGFLTYFAQDLASYSSFLFLHEFPKEIPVLLRETSDSVYSIGPFYISKVIMVTIQCIVDTFAYSIIVFYVAGLNEGDLSFILFFLPSLLCSLTSASFACCLSAVFENMQYCTTVMIPFNMITLTFSGMYMQISTLPVYLRWIPYISRYFYSVEAISIMQWTTLDNMPCPENDESCLNAADRALAEYGYARSDLPLDIIGLTVMFLLFNFVGYLGLKSRSKKQAYY